MKPSTPWMIDQDNAEGVVVKDNRGDIVHVELWGEIYETASDAVRRGIITQGRANAHAMVEAVNAMFGEHSR